MPTDETQPDAVPEAAEPLPPVDPVATLDRLRRDGRWAAVEPVKNEMIKQARARGMTRDEAQRWAYSEIDRLYPPRLPADEAGRVEGDAAQGSADDSRSTTGAGARESGRLPGLGEIPATWGTLPGNAKLAAELAWVQAERLLVVDETPNGQTIVRLDRARTPAPSMAALAWLETSIRTYAKYIEVLAKTASSPLEDEQQSVRRERLALAEIRELLGQELGTE